MQQDHMPATHNNASVRLALIVAVSALVLSGCLFKKDNEEENESGAQIIYNRAKKALDNGDFTNSIRYYETLEARFPFSNQARQGQLDLIYAHYRNNSPESVIDAAQQFERENPTHPRVDYTLYMRGMALFRGEQNYFHKLLRVDLSKRPPKDARDAYSAFAELLRRFPDSIYAPDARQRMIFLRNRIAAHENHVARFYLERGAYAAALSRANYTLQTYDGAPTTPETLQIMIASYRSLGMEDLANDAEKVLRESYPQAELTETADYDDAGKQPWYKFW
ncbi:MAG: outer membrane protein assembly factor BamD [Gammaproteobacteria bacterium]|nr:outer membrane protein assembly factor BamD [Gammaproteobacteria bacterium]